MCCACCACFVNQRCACCARLQILALRQKIAGITDSVKGIFTGGGSKDTASEKLDAFKGVPACSVLFCLFAYTAAYLMERMPAGPGS